MSKIRKLSMTFFAIVASLLLAFSLVGVGNLAFAAQVGEEAAVSSVTVGENVTYHDSLQSAIEAATDGANTMTCAAAVFILASRASAPLSSPVRITFPSAQDKAKICRDKGRKSLISCPLSRDDALPRMFSCLSSKCLKCQNKGRIFIKSEEPR